MPSVPLELQLLADVFEVPEGTIKTASSARGRTGTVIEHVKIDTTYNLYAYPSRLGLTMQTWFDDVAGFDGSW